MAASGGLELVLGSGSWRGGHCGTMDRAREIIFFFFFFFFGGGIRIESPSFYPHVLGDESLEVRPPQAPRVCSLLLGGPEACPRGQARVLLGLPHKPTIPEPASQALFCRTGPGPKWLPPAFRVKQEGRVWQPGMWGQGGWPGLPAAMQRSPGTAAVIG